MYVIESPWILIKTEGTCTLPGSLRRRPISIIPATTSKDNQGDASDNPIAWRPSWEIRRMHPEILVVLVEYEQCKYRIKYFCNDIGCAT